VASKKETTDMSTTTYTHHYAGTDAATATSPRKSFWRRAFDRMIEGRQRHADREIARFLETHGGVLTDDMGRQIMEHLSRRSRPSV
jgi:hypothetical protein